MLVAIGRLLVVVLVGARMGSKGRKPVMQHYKMTPGLNKYTILSARDEFFSFIKISCVSSLLKELNDKLFVTLFLSHYCHANLLTLFCKIGLS